MRISKLIFYFTMFILQANIKIIPLITLNLNIAMVIYKEACLQI